MSLPKETLAAIAYNIELELLLSSRGEAPFAFCVAYRRVGWPKVYWCATPTQSIEPYSCIVALIQNLTWHTDTHHALKIYCSSNYNVTAMCRGMAAFVPEVLMLNDPQITPQPGATTDIEITELDDRIRNRSHLDEFDISHAGPAPTGFNLNLVHCFSQEKLHTLHRIYMIAAFALIQCRVRKGSTDGHNIGAILVTPAGQVLSWGLNQYYTNHTFHAEVNTLQSYWKRTQRAVPTGSVLFTTLKPCKMCAGMIHYTGVHRVYMGQNDPGSHATNTDLDGQDKLFAVSDRHKPVRVYKSPIYSADREARLPDLKTALDGIFEAAKKSVSDQKHATPPSLTGIIDRNASWLEVLRDTLTTLARKSNKYAVEGAGNPKVRSALWHLVPLINHYGGLRLSSSPPQPTSPLPGHSQPPVPSQPPWPSQPSLAPPSWSRPPPPSVALPSWSSRPQPTALGPAGGMPLPSSMYTNTDSGPMHPSQGGFGSRRDPPHGPQGGDEPARPATIWFDEDLHQVVRMEFDESEHETSPVGEKRKQSHAVESKTPTSGKLKEKKRRTESGRDGS